MAALRNLALVGVGGGAGAILRYLLSGFVQSMAGAAVFPFGTFVVNFIGCFAAGFLAELAENHGLFTASSRLFVFTGILGGFTTFSAFGNETINLFRQSETVPGITNVAAHVFLCLGAVWAGRAVAHVVWR